jgi:MFS family permease
MRSDLPINSYSLPYRRRLAAVLIGNGLLRLANASGGALIGFYLADLANRGRIIDAVLVGALGLVANSVELLGAIPFGMLADRISIRYLLVIGALVGAIATQLFGLSGLPVIFFLSRLLEGMAAAMSGPALLTHLADVATGVSRSLRGRVASFFELSLLVGLSLGTLVGGIAWEWLWTGAFSLMAALYLVVAVLFYWGVGLTLEKTATYQTALVALGKVLTDPFFTRLAPAWLAANAIAGLWLTHIVFQLSGPETPGQYLVGRFDPREVGGLSLLYAMVFAIGIVFWGYALSRIRRLTAIRLSFAGMLATTLSLYLLNSSDDWPASARFIVLIFYAAAIIVQSGFAPAALAYLVDVVGRRDGRGSAMGVYTLLLGLGTALGAAFGGLLAKDLHINGLLLGTTVLAFSGLLSVAYFPTRMALDNEAG